MDQSDFNTPRNTAALVKPSRTNPWFLMVLFVGLLGNTFVANAATITSTVTGNWSAATTWSAVSRVGTISTSIGSISVTGVGTSFLTELAVGSVLKTTGGVTIGTVASITSNTALTLVANATASSTGINYTAQVVPKASDDVVISSGKTVTTTADAFANSINVYGILTINNGIKLTVYGNVNVASGAQFNAGTGNNDSATIIVYGNFINYGFANFWKSTVVIAGDLDTVSTILQNNGNIIVGGNVSGVIGGSGSGIVYPVNTNATVNVTGSADEKPPGTLPTSSNLLNLTNEVVYGGSCSFTIDNIASFSACSGSNAVFTVSTNGTSPTYQWQVNTNGSGWVDLENNATYTGVSIATLTITGVSITMNSHKYRAKITAGSPTTCTKNGNYGVLTVNTTPVAPTISAGSSTTFCSGGSVILTSSSASGNTWSTGATTQSITVSSGGTYTVSVNNGTCTSATSAGTTVTVNALPATPTISAGSSTTFCSGGSVTLTSSAGTTYLWSTGATTPSISPTTSGSYTVQVTNANGCQSSASLATVVTVNTLPTVSFTLQPGATACSNTDVTYTTQASQTNYVWSIPGVLNTDYTITSGGTTLSNTVTLKWLTSGSKTVTVNYTNSSGCPAAASSIASTVNINTWTSMGWSLGTPTSEQSIVFDSNFISDADITACSCTVNSGSNVVINPSHTLTVTNAVTVLGGSLTFEDRASLVQTNDAVNSGNITYKRSAAVRNTDYAYWSSPVSPLNLAGDGGISYFPPYLAGSIFYSYLVTSSSENWQSETAATPMRPGLGYAIRAAGVISTIAPSLLKTSFTGVPNNGDVTVPIVYTNPSNLLSTDSNFGVSYLLGNPYPSAIDADAFLTENASVIGGTLYFWTHNTAIQDRANFYNTSNNTTTAGEGALAYTSDDYASYNITGGVSAIAGSGIPALSDTGSINIPTGNIASGQGFFATGILTGNVTFKNSMRLGKTGVKLDNTQFFRTSSTAKAKTANVLEKHRIWLDLKNSQGAFKQTLVGYISGATNDYDNLFDGASYDGNDFVDFYSINQDMNLTIQGRALPFDENDTVPLGFKTTIAGSFTININQVDGMLTNQAVYLEDKVTNTLTNLKNGDYTFTTATGTFDDRFVLRYTDKTLGLNDTDQADGILVFYSNNYKTLIIKNNVMDATVNSVVLFNTTGQRIANFDIKDSGQTNLQIPIKNIASGIYIVKVKTTKGESSKKIIVN